MTIHLNTLFVVQEGAFVGKDHETVVVRKEHKTLLKVPMHHLDGIVVFGNTSVSPALLLALAERGLSCAYYSSHGRFLARSEGLGGRSIIVRMAQFRAAEDPATVRELARAFIAGKLATTRTYLRHAARDAGSAKNAERLTAAAGHVGGLLNSLRNAEDIDAIRGLEGAAAKEYFAALPSALRTDSDALVNVGRTRRPPRDPINALLSFGYSLLMRDCAGACAGAGLEPALGFLHRPRAGRLGLALDLMEEFRLPVVDRLVVRLINRRQLTEADFVTEGGPAVRMRDEARRLFLTEYQKSKQAIVRHEFLNQETTWLKLPHLQARLLARFIRGDSDAYVPFRLH